MAESGTSGKIPLTLHLSAEVAARLKSTADRQHRPPADVAAELLDRHLPRTPSAGAKPGSIPYS